MDGSTTPPPPTVDTAARKHVPPSWAGEPKSDYSLEVIKDGTSIQVLPINERDHYIIGRQPDVCEILLDHPSISRQHAALQFNDKDELYVCDLGSAHGTWLNKEKLQPKVYNKVPVSSVIKFGASTRLYVVHGPETLMPPEMTSEELERCRLESEKRQERKARERERAEQRRRDEEAGCMWGFAEDAFEEDDEEADARGLAVASGGDVDGDSYDNVRRRDVMLDAEEQKGRMVKAKAKSLAELTREATEAAGKIHEADQLLFDRMMKRRAKIENLQQEIARIRAKEGEAGLSEGQLHHIRKAEERIQELNELIEDNEETLRDRNVARQTSRAANKKKRGGDNDDDYDSENDEFYDRTIVKKKAKAVEESTALHAPAKAVVVDTWESLEAKLRVAEQAVADQEALIEQQLNVDAQQPAGVTEEVEDELESFMKANDVVFVSDTVQALRNELAVMRTEAARLQKLCDIARPALEGLKPKAREAVTVTSDATAATVAAATSPDTKAKPLTGVDKREAYWKERMKQAKASKSGGAQPQQAAAAKSAVADEITAEMAAPSRAGLGSGAVTSNLPVTSAAAAMKYAVNRLPSSADSASTYKPGLNSMK